VRRRRTEADGTPEGGDDDLQGIQSVETGIAVLQVLAEAGAPLTLGDVSRASGLSASQARRYLVSLVRSGIAAQDQSTGRYDLGSVAMRVGLAALGRVDAVEIAAASLKELVAGLREAGTLSVWGDLGATVVRWFRGGGIGVVSLGLGSIFPLLTSATGRVFLGFLDEDALQPALERELGAAALASRRTKAELAAIRAEVREAGSAVLTGHIMPEIRGAAAPVFDAQGELVAVMAIAGRRRDEGGRDPAVDALVAAAGVVSRQLCHKSG
jgi:DNA-binding IclR family transcriptional regulator